MKMKKLLPVLACGLAFTTLAACSSGSQTVEFGRYWQTDPRTSQNVYERLEYSVDFQDTAQSSGGIGYKLSYSNGTYVTTLERGNLNGKTVYSYSTQLNIKVTYEFDGQAPITNDEVVTSTCVFEDLTLQPVYSTKSILCYSPPNSAVDDVESLRVEYSYETSYDKTTGKATGVKVDGSFRGQAPIETAYEYDFTSGKYSVLDNEQLLFALRAISDSTDSATFRVINPFTGIQSIGVEFDDEETKTFSYLHNGETVTDKEITYRPVTMAINSTNSGATQTAWIAKPADRFNNPNRNLMLQLETPLAYNLGTLVYQLKSVTYQTN